MVIGMNGCSKSSNTLPVGVPNGGVSAGPKANEVWMQNTTFNPSTRTVAAGTTVTWINKDAVSHDVTSNTGLFASPPMSMNDPWVYTFTTAGTYNYHCTFHPGMNGTIIVQ